MGMGASLMTSKVGCWVLEKVGYWVLEEDCKVEEEVEEWEEVGIVNTDRASQAEERTSRSRW